MSTTPSERLRAARIARGFATAAEAARHFGWSEVTYTSHENGIRGLRKDAAERYGRAFAVDPATLLGLTHGSPQFDADQGVVVTGTASWGVWRDRRMLNAQVSTLIEVPKQAGAVSRRAVLVSDDSVNKVIAAGTFAIYEPISDLRTISSGKFVVIRRTQGDLEEISVRRVLSAVDGDVRLTAHSTNPAFKDTLTFNVDNDSDVQVVGLVVGKYATL